LRAHGVPFNVAASRYKVRRYLLGGLRPVAAGIELVRHEAVELWRVQARDQEAVAALDGLVAGQVLGDGRNGGGAHGSLLWSGLCARTPKSLSHLRDAQSVRLSNRRQQSKTNRGDLFQPKLTSHGRSIARWRLRKRPIGKTRAALQSGGNRDARSHI
jgi:hypothetical protein